MVQLFIFHYPLCSLEKVKIGYKKIHYGEKVVKKILIVDDEEDILFSIKMLVESMGHSAQTASNGFEALKILSEEKFDLVLLDIFMPEMSGRELMERIMLDPKLKNQKIAFLTVVYLSESGKNVLKKLKPVEYFQKPIQIKDFKTRLNKILK